MPQRGIDGDFVVGVFVDVKRRFPSLDILSRRIGTVLIDGTNLPSEEGALAWFLHRLNQHEKNREGLENKNLPVL